MKRLALALVAVFGLSLVGSGCDDVKKLIGMEDKAEEKKAEAAAPAEAAKPAEAAPDKAAEEALKKSEEEKKALEEKNKDMEKAQALTAAEVEKAKAEAEAKAAGAMAQGDKAKAEAEAKAAAAMAEAESTRKLAAQEVAKAQEEKTKAEEGALKLKKDTLASELTVLTEEHTKLKAELAANIAAWKTADATKAAEREAIMTELVAIEADKATLEAQMAADKLDDARNKLNDMKAKFAPLKEKATVMAQEKPVDPAKWEMMLNILTEETCMTKANMPAQEFQKMREVLFAQYEMDRVEYETLRAQFTRGSKPEDQAKLSEKLTAKCPDKAEKVEVKEEKKWEGNWVGTVSLGGRTDAVSFKLKGNALSGTVALPGATFHVIGGLGARVQFGGRRGNDYINCTGKKVGGEMTGSCVGALDKKRTSGSFKIKFKAN